MLRSDIELQKESNFSLESIRAKANDILVEVREKFDKTENDKPQKKENKNKKNKNKKNKNKSINNTLFSTLFDISDKTEDILSKCALAYLLKNQCNITNEDENEDKYNLYRRRKEIEIERLTDQLKSKRPNGRDLNDNCIARNNFITDDNEFKSWQAHLLKTPSNLPYPIDYESNEDLTWFNRSIPFWQRYRANPFWQIYQLRWALQSEIYSFLKYSFSKLQRSQFVGNIPFWEIYLLRWALEFKAHSFMSHFIPKLIFPWLFNTEERIYVSFQALGDKRDNSTQVERHKFEVWSDKRHLDIFKRFVEDINVKKQGNRNNSQKQYSAGLLTLRSGRIIWKEGKKGYKKHSKKGKPWNLNHLELHCTFDTRLWTKEGTEIVRLEKINAANKTIYNRQQRGELSETQQHKLEHKISERTKLENTFPGRPNKPLYQGQSHILVGVSLGLEKPATVAVFDAANNKVITYLSTKQLLGDNYKLLNRQRQKKQRLAHQRHKAQKQFAPNNFGESELGQYIDRLLSKEIVAIAKTYSAGSIVVPKLSDMREVIQSEVQAKAEKKILGYIEGQKNYAKEYRKSVHSWSYGRLINNIQIQAAKAGIMLETGQQPTRGSPQEQAKDLALFSYQSRIV